MRQWTNEHVFWYMTSAAAANITEILSKQNWNHFLLVVKAIALKQQISKLYLQIQCTDASDHIYVTQWRVINVKASFCAQMGSYLIAIPKKHFLRGSTSYDM